MPMKAMTIHRYMHICRKVEFSHVSNTYMTLHHQQYSGYLHLPQSRDSSNLNKLTSLSSATRNAYGWDNVHNFNIIASIDFHMKAVSDMYITDGLCKA